MSDLRPAATAVQARLQQLVCTGGPVPDFLATLAEALALLQFRAVLAFVGPLLFRGGGKGSKQPAVDTPSEAQSLQLVTSALLALDDAQQPGVPEASTLRHLLLQMLPAQASPEVTAAFAPAAVQLFTFYIRTPEHARLAVSVAAAFHLQRQDLRQEDWVQLQLLVQQLLQERSYTPAVRLLTHFQGLDEHLDPPALLAEMVEQGQETIAETWAMALGHQCKVAYIDSCLLSERTKSAARAVRKWSMHEEYPDIEATHQNRTLSRLLAKRLWPVAQSYAGSDASLQMCVLREMQLAGESSLAAEFAVQWGLPNSVLDVTPEALAQEAAQRREQYLEPSLPPEAVVFVDNREQLDIARQLLAGAVLVGFDVEWRPNHESGSTCKASLLQVATAEAVLLFDLLKLGEAHELNDVLEPLMASQATVKLAFGPSEDLGKLAGSWPSISAFRHADRVLDLRALWHVYTQQVSTAKQVKGRSIGLSALCEALLGKPLDKSMQMSNWEARPLTPRQQQYAALDAHVLLQLYDVVQAALGQARLEQVVAAHAYTYKVGAKKGGGTSGSQQQAENDSDNSEDDDGRGNGNDTPGAGTIGEAPLAAAATSGMQQGPLTDSLPVSRSLEPNPEASCARVVAMLQEQGLRSAFQWLSAMGSQGCHATASTAASTLAVEKRLVVKSVAVLAHGMEAYVVVTRGDCRLDFHQLAKELGVSRKAVRLATAAECVSRFGYRPGTVPPFGHAPGVKVLIDWRLDPSHHTHRSATCCSDAAIVSQQAYDVGDGRCSTAPSSAQHGDQQACHERFGELLYCGSGCKDAVVLLSFQQVLALSGGRIADVAEPGTTDPAPPGGGDGHLQAGHTSRACAGTTGSAQAQQQAGPGELHFLLDGMLGRLCRWLRCLGVDAAFIGKEPGTPEVARLASEQGRIFLTRNARLAQRRDSGSAFLLRSSEPEEQLAEVSLHFGIKFDEHSVLSRCSICNAAAFEPLPIQAAAGRVPERILGMVEEFWQCGNCHKVFWMGPKSYQAMSLVERLVNGAPPNGCKDLDQQTVNS